MAKKVKLLAIMERGKGKGNFSCFATESVDGCGINGFGRNSRDTIKDMQLAQREACEEEPLDSTTSATQRMV